MESKGLTLGGKLLLAFFFLRACSRIDKILNGIENSFRFTAFALSVLFSAVLCTNIGFMLS
jgi:hypothetical protein